MNREKVTRNEMIKILTKNLKEKGNVLYPFDESLLQVLVVDESECNWDYNIKGLETIEGRPIIKGVIEDARKKYNLDPFDLPSL